MTLPGGVDSILLTDINIESTPPVASNFHKNLQGRSASKYLEVYREHFSISTVKAKISPVIISYKAIRNPDLNCRNFSCLV